MKIGLPKEIKDNEYRVGLTPAGVNALVHAGHTVHVQRSAGEGSGFADEQYVKAGGKILETADEVWEAGDMIVKVKEPIAPEYPRMRENQLLFTYLHLAPEFELTKQMMDRKVTGVAYETITDIHGKLPLLTPMSEVAGRMSVQVGATFLEKMNGGRGILLGGVPGVPAANVVIIGGGVVGTEAAKMAVGLGAKVTIIDRNLDRLRQLDDIFLSKVQTLASSRYAIEEAISHADLVIGAVLVVGAAAPKLVTRDMLHLIPHGAVLVDVAVDQGGCFETTHATTHSNPTYYEEGVLHYCVANMPGAVPRTSTFALTNATLPYALALANKGFEQAIKDDTGLQEGVNTYAGKLTYEAVAASQDLEYTPLSSLIDLKAASAG
ncbi:MAG: alanine dehydrogenase [Blastocatellia bacterium]|nr:alanine dehydrogenase [Chloracidobacterium sp.]MBL8184810.1 alanine dehydrogenase [Blastocatellia bacterium]HBE81317.1 alanine dehydrogenase [Blastocatellia bacterium]HRJ87695.1 alanine dehydrogenase [Pyrinomonadaceae bacterium]HRK51127.1 alanine dehydrogenase [Pyrinomonadaceae bacterium]